MAITTLQSGERFLVGSKINLGVLCFDESNPANDISAATGRCWVYNDVDAPIMVNQVCTIAGTTLIDVQKYFDTTGLPPGKYRAIIGVTLGTIVQYFQWAIMLDPFPGP